MAPSHRGTILLHAVIARTSNRRLLLLAALAAVLGIVGGGAAWVLVHLIDLITNLALFQRVGVEAPVLGDLDPGWQLFAAAVLGAVGVSLLAMWAPVIRGHGIPETMEAVLTKQSRISPRTAFAKPISAALAIGTGAPFGAEGPIIVTGGAVGSLLGQVIPVSRPRPTGGGRARQRVWSPMLLPDVRTSPSIDSTAPNAAKLALYASLSGRGRMSTQLVERTARRGSRAGLRRPRADGPGKGPHATTC